MAPASDSRARVGPGYNEGLPGDLYLNLSIRPHPFFEREGDDLSIEMPVTLPELVVGAVIAVPTPTGDVSMTIPAGSKNQQRLRLRGQGVSSARTGVSGDLYATLQLVLPEDQDEKLQALAKQFEELYAGKDVREHMHHVKNPR